MRISPEHLERLEWVARALIGSEGLLRAVRGRYALDDTAPARAFASDILALIARLNEVEAERDRARFSPIGDNHHNAAACPYCSPALQASKPPSAEGEWVLDAYLAQHLGAERVQPTDGDLEPRDFYGYVTWEQAQRLNAILALSVPTQVSGEEWVLVPRTALMSILALSNAQPVLEGGE